MNSRRAFPRRLRVASGAAETLWRDARSWAEAGREPNGIFALAEARMAFDDARFSAQLERFAKALAPTVFSDAKVAAR